MEKKGRSHFFTLTLLPPALILFLFLLLLLLLNPTFILFSQSTFQGGSFWEETVPSSSLPL
jgi:hypothetical protein